MQQFYWEHRYAWQRAIRGYDSTDVFNMNDNMAERFVILLEDLKENGCTSFLGDNDFGGITKPLSSEYSKNEDAKIIDKMIYLAEHSYEDKFSFIETGNDLKRTEVTYEEAAIMAKQNRDELFDMLKIYWCQLWD